MKEYFILPVWLSNNQLAWAGIFARSARSSSKSVSVIISAGYRLLLAFFNVKPFSFIRLIDVRSTKSRLVINKFGVHLSPCKTSTTMSKKSVSIW